MYIYTNINKQKCLFVCMYVYTYIYVYLYRYTLTEYSLTRSPTHPPLIRLNEILPSDYTQYCTYAVLKKPVFIYIHTYKDIHT